MDIVTKHGVNDQKVWSAHKTLGKERPVSQC